MAEKKRPNSLEHIAKAVSGIFEPSSGGVKTPGGKTDYSQVSSETLTALTGLVGAVVLGKDANKLFSDPSTAKSLQGKLGNGILGNLNDFIKVYKQYLKDLDGFTNILKDNQFQKNIKTAIENLSKVEVKNFNKSIEGLITYLESNKTKPKEQEVSVKQDTDKLEKVTIQENELKDLLQTQTSELTSSIDKINDFSSIIEDIKSYLNETTFSVDTGLNIEQLKSIIPTLNFQEPNYQPIIDSIKQYLDNKTFDVKTGIDIDKLNNALTKLESLSFSQQKEDKKEDSLMLNNDDINVIRELIKTIKLDLSQPIDKLIKDLDNIGFNQLYQSIESLVNNIIELKNSLLNIKIDQLFSKIDWLVEVDRQLYTQLSNLKFDEIFGKISDLITKESDFTTKLDELHLETISTNANNLLQTMDQLIKRIDLVSNQEQKELLANLIVSLNSDEDTVKLIQSLSEFEKKGTENFNQIIDSIVRLNSLNINTQNLKSNIKSLVEIFGKDPDKKGFIDLYEQLANIANKGNDVVKDTKNISEVMNMILNVIKTYGERGDKELNKDKLNQFLSTLVELTTKNGKFQQLFENISQIHQVSITSNEKIESIGRTLEVLMQLADHKPNYSTINRNLSFLNKITDVSKGDIIQIFRNLQALSQENAKVNKNIIILKNFFDTVLSLGNIGFFKRIRIMLDLKFIKDFLADDIVSIIKTLSKVSKVALNEGLDKSLPVLKNFFEVVKQIGDLGPLGKLRMLINLGFIETFVIPELSYILSDFNELGQKYQESMKDALVHLDNFFKFVTSLNGLDRKQLGKTYDNLIYIRTDLIPEFSEVVKAMKSIESITKNDLDRFDKIAIAITNFNSILDNLPSFIQITKSSLKLFMMNYMVLTQLEVLIQRINQIDNIFNGNTSRALHQKTIKLFEYLLSIISYANTNISKKTNDEMFDKTINLLATLHTTYKIFKELDEYANQAIIFHNLSETFKNFVALVNDTDKLLKGKTIDESAVQLIMTSKVGQDLIMTANVLQSLADLTHSDFGDLSSIYDKIIAVSEHLKMGGYEDFKTLVKKITLDENYANNIKLTIENVKSLSELATIIGKIGAINPNLIQKGIDNLEKIGDKLKDLVNKLNKIDQKKVKNIKKLMMGFAKLIMVGGFVMLLGALIFSMVNPLALIGFTLNLGLFIFGFFKAVSLLDKKTINVSASKIKAFAYLILMSGITLAFGALVASAVDFGDLFSFTLMLGTFMYGMCYLLGSKFSQKLISNALDGTRHFALLVLACGFTVAVGSLLFTMVDWKSAFAFVFALTAFVFFTSMALILPMRLGLFKESLKGVGELAILILACGITLMIGSLLFTVVDLKSAFLFVGALVAFMFGITIPLIIFSAVSEQPMKGLRDFAILILASGLVLALGPIFLQLVPPAQIFAFALVLTGFIFAISLAYAIANASSKSNMQGAAGFAKVVGISAVVLLAGGLLFLLFPNLPEKVAQFGFILGGFILAISFAYRIANKHETQNLKGAISLAIIVGVSTIALLSAVKVMSKYPDAKENILLFTGTLLALIMGIGHGMKVLGKLDQKTLIKGTLALVAIDGVIYLSSLAMEKLANVSNIIDGAGGVAKFLIASTTMLGILGAVSLGIYGLGMLLGNPISAAFAYTAIGVVLAGAGAIWIVADAMQKVAKAMDMLSKVKSFKVTTLLNNMKGVISLAGALTPLVWMAPAIMMASLSLTAMAHMMSKMAEAVEEYSNLKVKIYEGTKVVGYRQLDKSDFKNAANNVKLIISTLGKAVIDTYNKNPEIFKVDLLGRSKFSKVVKSLKTLAPLISSIAHSVKDYSSLKVAEYQGTKIVGYRQLDRGDFDAAGKNVSLIISTLGKAVIDTYDLKPEMFETSFFGKSKFAKVTKSLKTLAPLISSIAKSVKTYADLKIVEEWAKDKEGNLVPSKYRHLDRGDFESASENISLIISTLGEGIIRAYEAHPDYYDSSFFGSSPFVKTINANKKLAGLISSIAKSVKTYADLKIVEEWAKDKDGNLVPSKYRHLDRNDFQSASDNISLIISTLGEGIIKAYEAHPDMYDGSGFLGMSQSPFAKTVNANMKLAQLISSIAKSVKTYASLTIPEYDGAKPDKDGNIKPTSYRHLDRKDFKSASDNISLIMKTLGEAIIKTYNDNPDMYDGSGFLGMGQSPFAKTINANMKLAQLIGTIGDSVFKMASGKIETDWDPKTGKPIGYEHLQPKHFKLASTNISEIISTLGKTIIEAYNEHEDWFDDGEDSDFAMACKAIGTMGDMIGSIAKGIQSYADLKFPVEYKDGKPVKFERLDEGKIKSANANILEIITTLGKTIIKAYEDHEDWFDDGEDSIFAQTCNALGTMGEMIGSIATGIQSYADLKFPIKYDQNGNPVDFKRLEPNDFQKAAENIGTVISTIGQAFIDLYNTDIGHEMFDMPKKSGLAGMLMGGYDGDNKFMIVASSAMLLGDVISTIAEGVQNYANGKIPTKWDSNGNPIEFAPLDDSVYGTAAENIGKVISTIGQAFIDIYGTPIGKEMFEMPKKGGLAGMLFGGYEGDNKFMIVASSVSLLGNVISSIAQGIQTYAMGKMPTKWDSNGNPIEFTNLPDTIYDTAAEKIGLVISTIGKAFIKTYKKNKELFEVPPVKVKAGPFGIFGSIEVPGKGDTPIMKVIQASAGMGTVISSIAAGVQAFASMNVPTAWGPDGTPTSYEKLPDNAYDKASKKISKVLTTLGEAIMTTYRKNAGMFNMFSDRSGEFKTIMEAFKIMGEAVGTISRGVQDYANLSIPVFVGGLLTNARRKMNDSDFEEAGKNVSKVLLTIGEAVIKTAKDSVFVKYTGALETVSKMYNDIGSVLPPLAEGVRLFGTLKFPVYTDGKITSYEKLSDTDVKNAIDNIGKLLEAIGNGILGFMDSETAQNVFGVKGSGWFGWGEKDIEAAPGMIAVKAISLVANPIVQLASVIKEYSGGDFKDANGNRITLSQPEIEQAKNNMKSVIRSMGDAIIEFVNDPKYSKLLDKENVQKYSEIFDNIHSSVETAIHNAINLAKLMKDGKNPQYIESFIKESKGNKDKTIIVDQISKIIKSFGDIASALFSNGFHIFSSAKDHSETFLNITKSSITLLSCIKSIKEAIDEVKFDTILQYFPELNDNYVKNDSNNIITELVYVFDKIQSSMFEELDTDFKEKKFEKLNTLITNIGKSSVLILVAASNIKKSLTDILTDQDVIAIGANTKMLSDILNIMIEKISDGNKDKSRSIIEDKIDDMKLISEFVDVNTKTLGTLVNRLKEIHSNLQSIEIQQFNTDLGGLIEGFVINVAKLSKINSNNKNGNGIGAFFDNLADNITGNASTVSDQVNMFVDSINGMIDLAERGMSVGSEGYDIVTEGIDDLYGITSKIEKINGFKQQQDILDKYVKSINSVKLDRLTKINQLATSLNTLAYKLGNLDKLTEAIANSLTGALTMLVKELKIAKDTIDKAEEMQTKRHKKIDDSVTNIKKIMSQSLRIEIKQINDTNGELTQADPGTQTTTTNNGSQTTATTDSTVTAPQNTNTTTTTTTPTKSTTTTTTPARKGSGQPPKPTGTPIADLSDGISSSELKALITALKGRKIITIQ